MAVDALTWLSQAVALHLSPTTDVLQAVSTSAECAQFLQDGAKMGLLVVYEVGAGVAYARQGVLTTDPTLHSPKSRVSPSPWT
jgi:hypothetical protein